MYSEVWNKPRGTKYKYKSADYSIFEDSPTECTIWLDSSEDPKKDLTDWTRNFNAIPIPVQFGSFKILLHRGFWEAFEELCKDLMPRIAKYKMININGCSHGGGTGQILVLALRLLTGKTVKSSVLFGCPKVFFYNHSYAMVKFILKDIHIVKLGDDIVHSIPPIPYYRVGTVHKIKYNENKFPSSLIKDHAGYWRYYDKK